MSKSELKQYIFVICASFLLVAASIAATLFTTGYFGKKAQHDLQGGYVNVTFTDAVLTCHRETRGIYGSHIHTLVTDNHSSRLEHNRFLYKIFLKMDLRHSNGDSTFLNYVNCFVHSDSGKIRKFEVFEDLEEGESPKTVKTNLFGMPIEDQDEE